MQQSHVFPLNLMLTANNQSVHEEDVCEPKDVYKERRTFCSDGVYRAPDKSIVNLGPAQVHMTAKDVVLITSHGCQYDVITTSSVPAGRSYLMCMPIRKYRLKFCQFDKVFIRISVFANGQDWRDFGLEMSTTSDEAAKMFDASLTQAVNHFDDPSVGGLEGTMEKMTKADPEFVLGHALRLGLIGSHVNKDPKFAQDVYKMVELAKKEHVKPWERQHANAVRLFAEGEIDAASDQWEDILIEHPRDMISLRFLHDMYIVNGQSKRLRDSLGRVVSQWTPSTPFYGDFLGMYAFGLEETNFYPEAEETARKALEVNRFDAWAAHAISHCKEMTGKHEDGIKFMNETENDWSDNGLGCHNYWHWALYYVEKGEFETALGILDNQVFPRMKKSRTNFSVTDSAALMFRLQAEGVDLGKRWDDVLDVAESHTEDHIWSFTDLNVFMTCLGAQRHDLAKQMLDSCKEYSRKGRGNIKDIYGDVTVPIMEAFEAYDSGDFDRTVDIMKPLRYKVQKIGGSHAQRDVFNLLNIHAAVKSKRPENQRYANHLLLERKSYKGDTPLVNRLTEKLVAAH